ncbi:M17L2-like protein [Mya arenaria]|uniref:M17L2-like protein n=2 Tax=Mya arenaria TaxID=6604 RepID=A0ABY7F0I4_MYAAR|nr:mpv17-like protein 2 isoform X2 [Mya arenaria]XP_052815514.1 mpv17-like protein 2 isoform X2 [Mya arenaria]WAR12881.1 M17L2-like protein [Mya arenaria]
METVVRLCNHRLLRAVQTRVKKLFTRRYLLYTNTAISFTMSCAGDGLQQRYQLLKGEMDSWDWERTHDVGLTGLVIGPFCHSWYLFLDWWLPGRSFRIVTKKLIVDQVICSPVCISSFLVLTSFLEGKRRHEIKDELIEKGKTLYTAEWIVWPPAQVINFCFLPTKYRVLFDNSVSFGFDWYFSYVKYGKKTNDTSNSVELESDISEDVEIQTEPKADKSRLRTSASHVPFLHMQAADIVQMKQDTFHVYSKRWKKRFEKRITRSSDEAETDSEELLD